MSDQGRVPVVLDAGPAVHQGAGLSRYTERLATHLLRDQGAEIDLTLFYNAHSGHQLPVTLRAAPTRTLAMSQVPWRISAFTSQVGRVAWPPFSRALAGLGTPLFHATEHLLPRVPGPSVLTVHDLIFERFPEHHTTRNVLFLRAALPRFVRAADAIIAVSHHTRADLVELYSTPAEKIHVIHEGIDPRFAPAAEEDIARVRALYSRDRPWLLMVGTLEPRKNHAAALAALHILKSQGFPHRLLLVGGRGWLFEPIQAQIAELGLEEDVTFAGYVPDADLPPLYSAADIVLMPSLYEGFGFPLLEAMACGAPVVASSSSSLPEVAGEAALLIPPSETDALAAALRLLLTQPALAAELRARGPRQAARFRWERCAADTAALYREVYARWMRTNKEPPTP